MKEQNILAMIFQRWYYLCLIACVGWYFYNSTMWHSVVIGSTISTATPNILEFEEPRIHTKIHSSAESSLIKLTRMSRSFLSVELAESLGEYSVSTLPDGDCITHCIPTTITSKTQMLSAVFTNESCIGKLSFLFPKVVGHAVLHSSLSSWDMRYVEVSRRPVRVRQQFPEPLPIVDLQDNTKEAVATTASSDSASNVNFESLMSEYDCQQTNFSNKALQCRILSGGASETAFYLINAEATWSTSAPLALVVGGVHGSEPAGYTAASQIRGWKIDHGRMIVFDQMNTWGVKNKLRYIGKDKVDLNREYPPNPSDVPTFEIARAMWRLCEQVQPKLFLDLHEGWGFYKKLQAQFGANEPELLVKNKKFSKGSSVIASANAMDVAEKMAQAVNHDIVDPLETFPVLTPPIDGGLAQRLFNAFGTQSLVTETTKLNQKLEKRVNQHLAMTVAALHHVGIFDNAQVPEAFQSAENE